MPMRRRGSLSAPHAAAPVNLAVPTFTVTDPVNGVVTASPGTWSAIPTATYTYLWSDSTTNPVKTLTSANAGVPLTVRVTATNSSGSSNATSGAQTFTAPVVPGTLSISQNGLQPFGNVTIAAGGTPSANALSVATAYHWDNGSTASARTVSYPIDSGTASAAVVYTDAIGSLTKSASVALATRYAGFQDPLSADTHAGSSTSIVQPGVYPAGPFSTGGLSANAWGYTDQSGDTNQTMPAGGNAVGAQITTTVAAKFTPWLRLWDTSNSWDRTGGVPTGHNWTAVIITTQWTLTGTSANRQLNVGYQFYSSAGGGAVVVNWFQSPLTTTTYNSAGVVTNITKMTVDNGILASGLTTAMLRDVNTAFLFTWYLNEAQKVVLNSWNFDFYTDG